MRGLGADHVISGPMRGLKKMHPMAQTNKQTDGHGDSKTDSVQLADSVKIRCWTTEGSTFPWGSVLVLFTNSMCRILSQWAQCCPVNGLIPCSVECPHL